MTTKNVSFFQQQDPSAIRNQLLAERLAKLAEPTPNEAVGGIVVKKSPLEFLAKSIASYGADRAQEKVYQAQLDAQNKRSQMLAQFLGVDGGMQGGGGSNPRASLYGQLLAVDPSGELAIKQKMEDAALTDMQKNSGWMGVTPEQQRSAWQQDAFKEPLKSGLQANVDPQGNITAAPVQGVAEYQAMLEGMLSNQQEQAKASRDLVDVTTPNGTYKMTREQAAAMAQGGGPLGQGSNPALTQSYEDIPPLQANGQVNPQTIDDRGFTQAPSKNSADTALPDASGFPGIPVVTPEEQKANLEKQRLMPKANVSLRSYLDKNDFVIKKIDEALGQVSGWTTGYTGGMLNFSGMPAYNLNADIDTIKSNIGFQELQEMRQNSPTGGAVGNLTEKELGYLQSLQGNLDTAQSADQVAKALNDLKSGLMQSRNRLSDAYKQDYGQLPDWYQKPALSGDIDAQIQALEKELGIRP